jgi:glycosyltransferase involved in cell wall biosynthesis
MKIFDKRISLPEHDFIPAKNDQNQSALFSVIIPTYTRFQFLRECINSVIKQTYSPYEIIFVDHNASQKNKEIINEYRNNYSNISIVRFFKNYGQWAVIPIIWNAGLLYSKGKYVYVLSDDDFLSENYLEKMVKLFQNNKNCVTAAPLPVSVDEKSNINPGDYLPINNRSRYTNGKKLAVSFIKEWLDPSLPKSFSAPGGTMVIRRDLLMRLGGFDDNNDDSQILKYAIFGDSGFDPEAKLYWRHHNNQSNMILKSQGNIFYRSTTKAIEDSGYINIWKKKFDNDQYKLLLKYTEFKKIFNIAGVFSEALRKKSPILVLKVMFNILKECPLKVIIKVYLSIFLRFIKYFKKNIVKYL